MTTSKIRNKSMWMALFGIALLVIGSMNIASAAVVKPGSGWNTGPPVGNCPVWHPGAPPCPPWPKPHNCTNATVTTAVTPLTTMYFSSSPLSAQGLSVRLVALSQLANQTGNAGAVFNGTYNGNYLPIPVIYPKNSWGFYTGQKSGMTIYVEQTHVGQYTNQSWADVQLFSWKVEIVCH